MIKVLYFASLRERMGRAEEDVAPPAGIDTVGDLLTFVLSRDPAAARLPAGMIRAAVNQEFATQAAPVRDGDEVAFFPPVTGG